MAEAVDQMIALYLMALRSVKAGRWEAPKEGFALGWLLIRNVQAVIDLARRDEALVTAAWSNARVAFELSARIVWMLQPADRYEAECRWLAFLGEYERTERKMAREEPGHGGIHSERADVIRSFREGVISVLPRGYHAARMPNLREMLEALDNPQMYWFYQEGSQYVHGNMYASTRYSKNLGTERILGDFTSIIDWILPMRLSWLSLRESTRFILDRSGVPEESMPNWNELDRYLDAAFQALTSYAVQARGRDAEV